MEVIAKLTVILVLLLHSSYGMASDKKKERQKPQYGAEHIFKEYTIVKRYKYDNNIIKIDALLSNIPGTKDEIYNKIRNYYAPQLTYYAKGQTNNEIMEGEGIYENLVSSPQNGILINGTYMVWVRMLDDGSVYILYNALDWQYMTEYKGSYNLKSINLIADYAPFNNKTFCNSPESQTEAFIRLVDAIHGSLNELVTILQQEDN